MWPLARLGELRVAFAPKPVLQRSGLASVAPRGPVLAAKVPWLCRPATHGTSPVLQWGQCRPCRPSSRLCPRRWNPAWLESSVRRRVLCGVARVRDGRPISPSRTELVCPEGCTAGNGLLQPYGREGCFPYLLRAAPCSAPFQLICLVYCRGRRLGRAHEVWRSAPARLLWQATFDPKEPHSWGHRLAQVAEALYRPEMSSEARTAPQLV